MPALNLSVALLHDQMVDKQGKIVCTSLTLIDVHDIARSSRTFGAQHVFIAHPSEALRALTATLKGHWETGFGSTYNPNRKEALEYVEVVRSIDDVREYYTKRGETPLLIATSARPGGKRVSFVELRKQLWEDPRPAVLLLGTGWGMSDELLAKADLFLEPVDGPGEYNHLSVRSACAIMLDRLCAPGRVLP